MKILVMKTVTGSIHKPVVVVLLLEEKMMYNISPLNTPENTRKNLVHYIGDEFSSHIQCIPT
jgi:hypothetical protein